MSLHTFKKKSVINSLGVKISGKPTNIYWMGQGPFGSEKPDQIVYGTSGFSLQGGRRNQGYIGKTYQMSVNGTPFYGVFPIGFGGTSGTYPPSQPVMNCPEVKVDTRGKQYRFLKPSVLSTKGMLERKYMWINNGQYPNYWVQPVYCNNNLSDNASQQVYIENKASANITVNDTNTPQKYVGYCRNSNNNSYGTNYNSFNIQSSNGTYTKLLSIPQDASQQIQQIQRKCVKPIGPQKPFPFAWNSTRTATIGSLSSSTVQTAMKGPPTPIEETPVYLEPPAWYMNRCNNVGQG